MKKLFYVLAFATTSLFSDYEEIDVTQDLRIHELIPRNQAFFSLPVEPAIPENFVALDSNLKQDYSTWVCWGPQDVLIDHFTKKKPLSEPVIGAVISYMASQERYGSFDKQKIAKQFEEYLKEMKLEFGNWGEYPCFTLSGMLENSPFRTAFVGLNEDGHVLQFQLFFPENKELEKTSLELWERFIKETKPLPEPLKIKALGQEMHIGHTIVNFLDKKLKVIVEKSKRDQRLQFAIVPLNPKLKFKIERYEECLMGLQWHFAEPLFKIHGSLEFDDHVTEYMTISVLIIETNQFSEIPIWKKNTHLQIVPPGFNLFTWQKAKTNSIF